jgi:Cytochrome c554 and c-prime
MTTFLNRSLFVLVSLFIAQLAGYGVSRADTAEPVCIQCHSKQPGPIGAPVAAWRTSVHAANGISCNNCHGGDPTDMAMAMSPERGFLGAPKDEAIPAFCGRCHVGVEEDYRGSAHGHALGKGGPQCVTCHGNHGVQRATSDLINEKDCTRCHSFERARIIKAAMTDTDRQISELERSLAELKMTGVVTKQMDGDLFAVRNRFHRLFHSVEVEKVRSQTAGFQADLAKIRDRVAAIRAVQQRRKIWGAVVIGLLLCCGGTALLMYRSYKKDI